MVAGSKELALPPGTYEYRLVVDGEWIADPRANGNRAQPVWGNEFRFESEWMRQLTMRSTALLQKKPCL